MVKEMPWPGGLDEESNFFKSGKTAACSRWTQQLENLKTTWLLKKELGIPFLFLSGGENTIHRRLGGKLGCCMSLCIEEHDALSAFSQPLLSVSKAVRDDMGF